MKIIFDKFLKAKHWQIFILAHGTLIVTFFYDMFYINDFIVSSGNKSLNTIMNILFAFGGFGWLLSVGFGLRKKIPNSVKLNIKSFKLSIIILLIYFVYFYIFSEYFLDNYKSNETIMNTFFTIHTIAMLFILYILLFVSKTFKTAELQRKVTFSDYAGDFFLFWFYPVGIWILQPKINKIVNDESKNIDEF